MSPAVSVEAGEADALKVPARLNFVGGSPSPPHEKHAAVLSRSARGFHTKFAAGLCAERLPT